MKSALRRYVRNPAEAALLLLAVGFFRVLPLDAASALGGLAARTVGPRLRVSNVARRNLARAFPERSSGELETLLRGVWDNVGRTAAEYPHLARIAATRVEIVGLATAKAARDDGKPGIFFSAHMANWEVLGAVAARSGLPLTLVYRALNNELADRLLRFLRRDVSKQLLRKGPSGARDALAALKGGAHLGLLVDQKMNDGIAAPFFGRPAMTAPALAQLAYRYDCPVIPAQTIRLKGARFRVIVHDPLTLARTGDRNADILATMSAVNLLVEEWIRQAPEQWLWLHKRWPRV
jgi:KDO2-lipid IV(A) lauroyltransferase